MRVLNLTLYLGLSLACVRVVLSRVMRVYGLAVLLITSMSEVDSDSPPPSLEMNRISQRYPSTLNIYLNLTLNFSLCVLPTFSFVHLILPSSKPKKICKETMCWERSAGYHLSSLCFLPGTALHRLLFFTRERKSLLGRVFVVVKRSIGVFE